MYAPVLGRFLQRDPIGYQDGMNVYGYVGSDAVNNTDSYGLKTDINDWVSPEGGCENSGPSWGILSQFPGESILENTAEYATYAGTAAQLSGLPQGQVASVVLFGVAAGSEALKISIYSSNKIADTTKAIVKQVVPVEQPYSMFTDKAVDVVGDKVADQFETKQREGKLK